MTVIPWNVPYLFLVGLLARACTLWDRLDVEPARGRGSWSSRALRYFQKTPHRGQASLWLSYRLFDRTCSDLSCCWVARLAPRTSSSSLRPRGPDAALHHPHIPAWSGRTGPAVRRARSAAAASAALPSFGHPGHFLRWHRRLVRTSWTYRRPGRPPINEAIAALACGWRRRLSWGCKAIQGELLTPGHRVGASTIRRILISTATDPRRRRSGRPTPAGGSSYAPKPAVTPKLHRQVAGLLPECRTGSMKPRPENCWSQPWPSSGTRQDAGNSHPARLTRPLPPNRVLRRDHEETVTPRAQACPPQDLRVLTIPVGDTPCCFVVSAVPRRCQDPTQAPKSFHCVRPSVTPLWCGRSCVSGAWSRASPACSGPLPPPLL